MAEYNITHSEENKGWTSFWSFIPDWFSRIGERFFSIKNGQLWIHNDPDAGINSFYGTTYSTSVKTVFTDAESDDKSFKTLILECGIGEKWSAAIKTNYTESSIADTEFNTRESRQFSFIRQTEDSTDLNGGAVQGIGVIQSVTGLVVSFNSINDFINIGDQLYQINGESQELIGTITDKDGQGLTIDAFTTTPQAGYFAYAKKNVRVEGSDVRGRYMEVTLTNSDENSGELFAVSANVSKSYV